MPYYCTVPHCTSMAGKAKNVSFHQFPRDANLAKLWNKVLKRGKPYTKYSKVCSLHFTPEDYTINSVGKKGQWRSLHKDAVPSRNLPSDVRRDSGSSSNSLPPMAFDNAQLQQQFAQAIYMQTMLAMHAARSMEQPSHFMEHEREVSVTPDPDQSCLERSDSPSTESKSSLISHGSISSLQCQECYRCFKDPDVFFLHQRSHREKENLDRNKPSPLLASLLKNDNRVNLVLDESV